MAVVLGPFPLFCLPMLRGTVWRIKRRHWPSCTYILQGMSCRSLRGQTMSANFPMARRDRPGVEDERCHPVMCCSTHGIRPSIRNKTGPKTEMDLHLTYKLNARLVCAPPLWKSQPETYTGHNLGRPASRPIHNTPPIVHSITTEVLSIVSLTGPRRTSLAGPTPPESRTAG
jgi:hypothetical protein